ncbi:MAG: aminopeptidase P N-terminal domain-containing protein [Acidobacteriota bacterium]|jgi:Xaa-Pro aminopeptidase|nr:aminopeptidase P N-terminal domain-containing protein [Acidobacteriota bacterium]
MRENVEKRITGFSLLILVMTTMAVAAATPYAQRRVRLLRTIESGTVILFGSTDAHPGKRFRQDNDFYYLTGLEESCAVLVMRAETGRTALFLPRQSERERMIDGDNLLLDAQAPARLGIEAIYPVSYLDEYLARVLKKSGARLWVRLAPADPLDGSRWETGIFTARAGRCAYNDVPTIDQLRVQRLRQRYPFTGLNDISPVLDRMRMIKDDHEIEILRRNGKISAEAIIAAIKATRPGAMEYELEAAAVAHILKTGADGPAYAPIVGSGPNSCVWHYNRNHRKMQAGEVVLMDFGADLDHYAMDITRTWPVNGRFSAKQKEMYDTVLAIQKASIEAYRPGVTLADVKRHVARRMQEWKIPDRGLEGVIHHYLGLSTHDVGEEGLPLEAGMVFTAEPGLYDAATGIGIRIEDTVLITEDGCEVLSRFVPKEINEIEALMAK